MAKHILFCQKCCRYTLHNHCSLCQMVTIQLKPLKYSPEDPYGHYRRQVKRPELTARGLL